MRLVRFDCSDGGSMYINPETVESVFTETNRNGTYTVIGMVSGVRVAVKDTLEVAAFKVISGYTKERTQ